MFDRRCRTGALRRRLKTRPGSRPDAIVEGVRNLGVPIIDYRSSNPR